MIKRTNAYMILDEVEFLQEGQQAHKPHAALVQQQARAPSDIIHPILADVYEPEILRSKLLLYKQSSQ